MDEPVLPIPLLIVGLASLACCGNGGVAAAGCFGAQLLGDGKLATVIAVAAAAVAEPGDDEDGKSKLRLRGRCSGDAGGVADGTPAAEKDRDFLCFLPVSRWDSLELGLTPLEEMTARSRRPRVRLRRWNLGIAALAPLSLPIPLSLSPSPRLSLLLSLSIVFSCVWDVAGFPEGCSGVSLVVVVLCWPSVYLVGVCRVRFQINFLR